MGPGRPEALMLGAPDRPLLVQARPGPHPFNRPWSSLSGTADRPHQVRVGQVSATSQARNTPRPKRLPEGFVRRLRRRGGIRRRANRSYVSIPCLGKCWSVLHHTQGFGTWGFWIPFTIPDKCLLFLECSPASVLSKPLKCQSSHSPLIQHISALNFATLAPDT